MGKTKGPRDQKTRGLKPDLGFRMPLVFWPLVPCSLASLSGFFSRSLSGLKCPPADACWPVVDAPDAKLSFEAALGKLETIVESMESGEVPLAELLAKFEEGTKLLKVCESRLKDAELKIEQLKKQKDGSIAFEKFEASRED